MAHAHWLRTWLTRPDRQSQKAKPSSGRTRLGVVQLEDRATPAVFTVDLLTDENDGNTTVGDISLREAIGLANAATDADEIRFSPSLLTQGLTQVLTLGELTVTQPLSVLVDQPLQNIVTISGNNDSRIFHVTGAALTLNGLVLTNGAERFGAAILVDDLAGSALTATYCVFQDNTATGTLNGVGAGGAIYTGGATVLDRNTFVNNRAIGENGRPGTNGGGGGGGGGGVGGALFSTAASTVTIRNTTFSANSAIGGNGGNGGAGNAGDGGRGGNQSAEGGLAGFVGPNGGDYAGGGGGGASANGGTGGSFGGGGGAGRTVGTGITIPGKGNLGAGTTAGGGNSASSGGGSGGYGAGGAIFNNSTSMQILNVTLTENAAVAGAGGNGGNSAANNGEAGGSFSGAVHNAAVQTGVTIRNTIATGNLALAGPNFNTPITSTGFNLIGSIDLDANLGFIASDQQNSATTLTRFLNVNQVFYIPGDETTWVDRGSNSGITSTSDQRGAPFARIVNGDGSGGATIDIGAYESQPFRTAINSLVNGALIVDSPTDILDGNYTPGNLTLREALSLANANPGADTIRFNQDVFITPQTISLAYNRLTITDSLTIVGTGADQLVLDGQSASQLLFIDGGTTPNSVTVNIERMGFTNGRASSVGKTIDGVNSGSAGGAIFNNRGNLTLREFAISNSFATFGGGLYLAGAGTTNLLREGSITGNATQIVGKSTGTGGGVNNDGTTATFVNVTIAGNTAAANGGGAILSGTNTFTNVTIANNRSNSGNTSNNNTGGGVTITGGLTIFNTIVAGNFRGTSNSNPDDVRGTLVNTSSNNIIGNTATAGGLVNGTKANQVGVNPLLGNLQPNSGRSLSMAPGQNSPALATGSAAAINYAPWDQRGTARDTGTPDIGAYEVQHPLATVGAPTDLGRLYAPQPSASADEAFVKGLYQATLLRAADSAGLAGWLAALNGGATRTTVANGFVNSIENRQNQVRFFYRYFLAREAEQAGLDYWVNRLRSGDDEGFVMQGFILSPEFTGNNSNEQFVSLMYYALLSRPSDPVGYNGWLAALNGGETRGNVENAFLRSTEGSNRVINSMFQTYLKRYATDTELTNFRTLLKTQTFGTAATQILSGSEFYANADANR